MLIVQSSNFKADLSFKLCCFMDKYPANTIFFIAFQQSRQNVFDVGPTLLRCYKNVLCLLGKRVTKAIDVMNTSWVSVIN